jgi:hypothetical protein
MADFRAVGIFLKKIIKWKGIFSDLKRDRQLCLSVKKAIDDKLTADKTYIEVLKCIRKEGDPEQGLDSIMGRASSQGRFLEYGQWLLEVPQFKGWANRFQYAKSTEETKRALWIRGNYGTGKTTLVLVSPGSPMFHFAVPANEATDAASSPFCNAKPRIVPQEMA